MASCPMIRSKPVPSPEVPGWRRAGSLLGRALPCQVARWNTGHLVKSEFQIRNESFCNKYVSRNIFAKPGHPWVYTRNTPPSLAQSSLLPCNQGDSGLGKEMLGISGNGLTWMVFSGDLKIHPGPPVSERATDVS